MSPTNPNIIKIDDTEDKTQLTQGIMVPTKWARNYLLESCTPYDLINYLATMINEWELDMIKNMEYIRDWAIGACFVKIKTKKKNTLQLEIPLEEIDTKSNCFEDW